GEVVPAQLFLLFETKWTVIGGDDLQVIAFESVPEFLLVPLFSQRWSENVFRAFKIGHVEIFDRKVEVLGAGLGINRKTAVASFPHFFERVIARQVHDVDGRARHLGQRNRSRRRFCFGGGRSSQGVIFRRLLPLGQGLLDDDVNRTTVFGVHTDQAAILRRGL